MPDTIREQWAKMGFRSTTRGSGLRWTKGCPQAVREVFVRLYEKGLIYRGKYIINWDPAARTALSDIEVEYKEVNGHLYHLAISAEGRQRHHHGGDDPAGDDAGRYGGSGSPGR